MNVNLSMTNWKTTVSGAVAWLLAIPGIYDALHAWATGMPVNWKAALVSIAIAVAGTGLVAAKDSTTHSTSTQVAISSAAASKGPAPK